MTLNELKRLAEQYILERTGRRVTINIHVSTLLDTAYANIQGGDDVYDITVSGGWECDELVDAVTHEVAHIIHPGHGPEFHREWHEAVRFFERKVYHDSVRERKVALYINGQRKSQQSYDDILYTDGPYFIATDHSRGMALFSSVNGEQISSWFHHIYAPGVLSGTSGYYVASIDGGSISHFGSQGIPHIKRKLAFDALHTSTSPYFVVRSGGAEAVIHINGTRVTGWYPHVLDVRHHYAIVKDQLGQHIKLSLDL